MAMINVPTPITSNSRIDLLGSPKHLNITHTSTFDTAIIKIWVWTGLLVSPIVTTANPNVTLKKSKVSSLDLYITFEIGSYIKDFINPKIMFDSGITTSSEGVFYQYEVEIYRDGVKIATQTPETRFATLGYNWAYEGESTFTENRGSFGFETTQIDKFYNPMINYTKGVIDISGVTNSNLMVTRTEDVPLDKSLRCSKEPYVILYLNKMGIWDTFTPNGKVVVSNKIDRDSYEKSYRNPLGFNYESDFGKVNLNINSTEVFNINTGALREQMGMLVEEILYSPKVYLIQFNGDTFGGDVMPFTVDTTLVSVDTTEYSADATIIGLGGVTKYLTYRQIPVLVTDSDFTRKSRLNDKNKISYNIKFETSVDKINNIR